MIISNGKNIDKKCIRELWDECFDEDSRCWREWYFENIFKENNVIGTKENGKLISMVHMNPYNLFIREGKINSFALAGVATQNEHRKKGLAGSLIKYALKRAYQDGYAFSFLYPFKYEYYEKFGYRLSYNNYSYKQVYLPHKRATFFKVNDMYDSEKMSVIYNRMAKKLNGYVIRDKIYYDIHIKELLCDNDIVCFSYAGSPGYFAINKSKDTVEEIVCEGSIVEVMQAISIYYGKDILFKNLFDIEQLMGTKKPQCMGRVVSVEKIFSAIKMKKVNIKITVTDKIIAENNCTWHIVSERGDKTYIRKTEEVPDFSIDISQLAPIITGFDLDEKSTEFELRNILFKSSEAFIFEVC